VTRHFLPSTEIHSRIVTAPDGMDYLIAMTGWHWNSLDWSHENTEWDNETFIRLAWTLAKQRENDGRMEHPGNFVAEFATTLQSFIWLHISRRIEKEAGLSNDNS
jgi:hypothetical protein